jgi:hypothetical protein
MKGNGMKRFKLAVAAAAAAFVVSGPLQHVRATPVTAMGDASKQMLKAVLETIVPSAHAGGMCSAAKARARAKLASKGSGKK